MTTPQNLFPKIWKVFPGMEVAQLKSPVTSVCNPSHIWILLILLLTGLLILLLTGVNRQVSLVVEGLQT